MTTSVNADLRVDWQQWHSARERALATPHGWLSLTSFHWLPHLPSALSPLPGSFSVDDGHAILTAGVDDGYALLGDEDGLRVPVDGRIRAQVAEAKSLEWLSLGQVIVELALRGGRYCIRTRDPQARTRLAFTGVRAFDVDEKWLVN